MLRSRPPRKTLSPPWEAQKVFELLSRAPYEPLDQADIKALSCKTAFLLAITTALRASDLCALSIQDECLIMEEDKSQVTLRPNPAFVGKSGPLATISPVVLHTFPPPGEEGGGRLRLVCPVRALDLYLERTGPFRGTTKQLLVCYQGAKKGQPITPEGLARWIREVIAPAVDSERGDRPRAHATRGLATSLAALRGVSVVEICKAARWSSAAVFRRFYLRDVASNSLAHAVLESARESRR